jgi:hypothetical protein
MKNRFDPETLTAYHEAGHAVVDCLLGLPLEEVSVVPDEESMGRVSSSLFKDFYKSLEDEDADEDEVLEVYLVSLLAGIKAVEILTGEDTHPYDPNADLSLLDSDYGQAGSVILSLAGPTAESQAAVYEQAVSQAEGLLREIWPTVEVLAEALLKHKTLTGSECAEIVARTASSKVPPRGGRRSGMRGLLEVGVVKVTLGALEALREAGVEPEELLWRHATGDWGELSEADRQKNELSIREGSRVFSSYPIKTPSGTDTIWVLTEADRSATTLLKPEEYKAHRVC